MALITSIRARVDNEISDLSAEQIPALTAIISGGANDHIIASEITEATTASAAASAQLALDLTWETNIDSATPDLSTPTLTARQTVDLTPRNVFIPTREAQILVTLSTRVSPRSLFASRFFFISRRARITDGTLSESVRITKGIAANSAQIVTNTAAISDIQDILNAQ